MKTAVSLITSVLWPFLICNIAILKKDLTVSLLVIFFLVWVGCSLYLSVEFMLLYLVNAFVKYFHQVFLPIFSSHRLVLVVSIDHWIYLAKLCICVLWWYLLSASFYWFSCQCIQLNFIKMAASLIATVLWLFLICNIHWKWFGSFIFRPFISTQMLAVLLPGCASRQLKSRSHYHIYKYPTI